MKIFSFTYRAPTFGDITEIGLRSTVGAVLVLAVLPMAGIDIQFSFFHAMAVLITIGTLSVCEVKNVTNLGLRLRRAIFHAAMAFTSVFVLDGLYAVSKFI